jgi:hypothetical protein
MQRVYSSQTLAALSGTQPRGNNASLLDLIDRKPVSFDTNGEEIVVLVVFKSDLFVYLKEVGLASDSNSNVKRMKIDYIDHDNMTMATKSIDSSVKATSIELIENVAALKITFEETFDGKAPEHILLTVRGCFGRHRMASTTTMLPSDFSRTTEAVTSTSPGSGEIDDRTLMNLLLML